MTRLILLVVALLGLAACSTQPVPLAAHATAHNVIAVGTLAPFGSAEWQLAPAYTRNAVVRQRAANALNAGRIDVATARQVLAHTDAARALLDSARHAFAESTLNAATERIDAAAALLEPPQ